MEMKSSLKESASLPARSRTFCRDAAMAGCAFEPETLGSLAMAALAPARSCCTRTPAPSRTGRTTPSRSSSSAASRCMGRTSGLPFSAARDAAAWMACCDLTVNFSHLNGIALPLMQMDGGDWTGTSASGRTQFGISIGRAETHPNQTKKIQGSLHFVQDDAGWGAVDVRQSGWWLAAQAAEYTPGRTKISDPESMQ